MARDGPDESGGIVSDPGKRLSSDTEDNATIGLLRLAGPRAAVSPMRAARVRSAVLAEWQIGTRRRANRKRVALAGLALGFASLLVFAGRVTFLEPRAVPLGEPVAIVAQVDGDPQWTSSLRGDRKGGRIRHDDVVRIGEWIETGDRSRVALRFGVGTSVRLDSGSRVRPLAPGAIELSAGAVYVDSGNENSQFEVRTPLGIARDIGTQFEVRLIDETLRLRVRTGVVELTDRARSISGRAGTEITMSSTGAVSRPTTTHGAEWDWTTRVSPPLEMEGVTLATFLGGVAREQGWTVEYRETTTAHEAARIILHGSVRGLAPEDAVEVAVTTSGFHYRLESGVLTVFRAPPERR